MTAEQVERIWDAALGLYRSGVHPALQLCLRREGEVVLDRAIGHARGNGPDDGEDAPKVPATTETPFCVYSTSKGITAMVVHMLVERGALEIDDRVADHIPEYARHGKDEITIGHVLAHRAGVASLPKEALDLDLLDDRERLVELICDAKPTSAPGKLLAYHAVSGGFILGEIVERVTGKPHPRGARRGDPRPARLSLEQLRRRRPRTSTGSGSATSPARRLLPPVSNLVTRALGAPIDEVIEASNDPRFLTGVIPAANVVTTANELSRFFEIFRRGGELDGVRVMKPETLRRALTEQSRLEIDLSLDLPDPVQLRADARREGDQPLRPRHRPRLRPPRPDQHHGLGRPRARDLRRPDHQRQGDPLPGGAPLLRGDAADRLRGAEGAGVGTPF